MPKIIVYITSSLDGFIAKKDGNIDWLFHDQDYGYYKFISTIDTIIMGSKTYQQVLSFGEWPYKDYYTFVFTHQNLPKAHDTIKFISGSVADKSSWLRKQSKKNIWLVGGSELITQFANYNLIDEFIIFVHPLYLGEGIPMVYKSDNMKKLKFTKTKSYKSGMVEIHIEKE